MPSNFPTDTSRLTFLTERTTLKACSMDNTPPKVIYGLNGVDRNLADAMSVTRNVILNPTLVPSVGAVEIVISICLHAGGR